jgi:hypothetical protein
MKLPHGPCCIQPLTIHGVCAGTWGFETPVGVLLSTSSSTHPTACCDASTAASAMGHCHRAPMA